MKKFTFSLAFSSVFLMTAGVAQAASSLCSSNFNDGTNPFGFSFGAPREEIASTGGVTGGFLHATGLLTFWPLVDSNFGNSCFGGNYVTKKAKAISANFLIPYVEDGDLLISVPVTLILTHNLSDGEQVKYYTVSKAEISATDGTWTKFDFSLPSGANSWPAEWHIAPNDQGEEPAAVSPRDFFSDVSGVGFYLGDVQYYTLLRAWEVGFDDVELMGD